MSMYEKYEHLLNQTGETTADVARATNIAKSTFSGWKNGKFTPKKDKIELIAEHFSVPTEYFYENVIDDETRGLLNRYIKAFEVSAGNGRICSDSEAVSKEDGYFAKVVGDSMAPSLLDGDVVRIIETTEVEPSDFALVRINGEEMSIKHIEVTSDGIWVKGENPNAYKDRFFTVKEVLTLPVQIVGKAVELTSRRL